MDRFGSPNYKSPSSFHRRSPNTNWSDQESSPDFSPYKFSSPSQRGFFNRGNRGRRVFSEQYDSPPGPPWRNQNRHKRKSEPDITLFAHPSMLDDPWIELEKMHSLKVEGFSPASSKDLDNAPFETDKTSVDETK